MPSMVYKLFPGYPEEYDDTVLPAQLKASTLRDERTDVAKLVLIHCDPNDLYTLVFEKKIPAELTKGDIEEQFDDFVAELNPDNFTARVTPSKEHAALLEEVSEKEPFGLIVRHCVAVRFVPYCPN